MMVEHLFIVARQSLDLHEYLARQFAAETDVRVILDRRQGERRANGPQPAGPEGERRQADRRQQADIAGRLTTLGYAFVRRP